ncbi:helix-turn-helix domain-containing protein [Flagellimonas meridianipacifica]|uniref:Helix-turn-helix protein n=1 Tax=Flagellimonas meridianipacifica TaxID=1080225 RepID=A0A2T0MA91_9FLAO|nr:helix-turn-helix transcriptional regulator [Allomuricauda pacifica]PRX54398.1 helix-turn-helix protein [Allomuricauda pacifica]
MPKNLSKEDVKLLTDFGRRLRRLRKECDLTQDELEHKAKVHDNMIGRLERGERIPNFLQLIKISNALEIEISEFFSDPPEESE